MTDLDKYVAINIFGFESVFPGYSLLLYDLEGLGENEYLLVECVAVDKDNALYNKYVELAATDNNYKFYNCSTGEGESYYFGFESMY